MDVWAPVSSGFRACPCASLSLLAWGWCAAKVFSVVSVVVTVLLSLLPVCVAR
jgi:hypothetical protein